MKNRVTSLFVAGVGALAMFASACVPEQPTGGNQAPVAAFTADPTSGVAPLEVAFNAAASSDPDGTITGYAWDFGDGGSAASAAPSHTFTTPGAHVVTLTVTDNAGATDGESTTITVTSAPVNQSPVAAFVPDVTSGTAPMTVTFDSSASSDPDGTITGYAWDFGDGNTSTDPGPTHDYTTPGVRTVTLTVTDDDGATATATAVITVGANQPPTAAGSATPTSGRAPLTVAFDAEGSSDPENASLSFDWDFGDGGTAGTAQATHVYAVGEWTATLTVTDDRGQTDTRQFTVTAVANQAPIASAQALPSTGDAPLTVQFDSSLSTDDLGIVSYLWDFDDSTTSTDANPTHVFVGPGTYDVELTVTDGEGASHTSSVAVAVSTPNQPPTANAVADVSSGKAPLVVGFDGTASTDDRGIASYAWDFGDGGTSTIAEPSHTFAAGTHTVVLTVTDTDGVTNSDSVTITVVPNQAPTADAVADLLAGKAPLAVQFDGTGSTDGDGSIVSYAWDFGDGDSSTIAEPAHTFAAGTHTVVLTVTDDSGATDTASVTIVASPNTPPTAAANADVQTGPRPLVVHFTSASIDPDGTISGYAWDFGDGGTSTAEAPTHTFAAGTWPVTLTVTDDSGATATSVAVSITAYVDDDGDGVSPPADCDDDAPGTYPGAPDPFDDEIDANCDGVDGPADAQLFVAATGGVDTASCGTLAAPCATITGADLRATATGIQRLTVAGGSYARFAVSAGRTIRGGYGQNFLRGAAATGSTVTTVNASFDAAVGGPVAIVATNINAATTISDVTVSGATAAAGQASYGIVIRNSSALTLARVTVNAGTGGAGTDGTAGTSASQTAANGGNSGEAAEQSSSACSTSRKSGGSGGTTSTVGANGGGGGQGGARDSSCPFSFDSTSGIGGGNAATVVGSLGTGGGGGSRCDCGQAGAGGDGQPGRTSNGTGGGAGVFAAANGTIDASGLWTATNGSGGNGTLGLDGTGGGGGGGGGGNDSGTDSMGGGGGGGGAGGARATAVGTGGSSGKASIGISIAGSTPTLVDVVVNLGSGGKGGNGGAGGLGQPGGAAGSGGPTNNPGGRGGNGGAGGAGGHSGAGGGGAGGPAIGVAVKSSTIAGNAVSYQGGTGGAGGSGGSGGVAGTAGTAGARTTLATV